MFEEDRQRICCLRILDLSVIVKVIMVEEEEVYEKKRSKSKKKGKFMLLVIYVIEKAIWLVGINDIEKDDKRKMGKGEF